jgi:hypothetical protein
MHEYVVKLICCGRDDGEFRARTWDEADAFREAYVSGVGVGKDGHQRAAIIERVEAQERTP